MRAIKITVLAAMCFGMVVGSAHAQEAVVVKVPFSFMVRGHEFAAGRYEVTKDGELLSVRGLDHGDAGFAVTMPAAGRDPVGDKPALVFTRYENEYQLSEVWENETEGLAIPEPSEAAHHAKAQAVAPDATILIPANSR